MVLLCPDSYGLQKENITKEKKGEEKEKSTAARLRTVLNSFCNEIHHKSRETSFSLLLKFLKVAHVSIQFCTYV